MHTTQPKARRSRESNDRLSLPQGHLSPNRRPSAASPHLTFLDTFKHSTKTLTPYLPHFTHTPRYLGCHSLHTSHIVASLRSPHALSSVLPGVCRLVSVGRLPPERVTGCRWYDIKEKVTMTRPRVPPAVCGHKSLEPHAHTGFSVLQLMVCLAHGSAEEDSATSRQRMCEFKDRGCIH
ncbi:hypothetical protein O3P69_015068 [Scylla paramamosain]|uniref:Uncharacterized protein n=1 Tax=Scylla paramamosain TaxID=85552 RepID=A0AAW0T2E0_SCYPA